MSEQKFFQNTPLQLISVENNVLTLNPATANVLQHFSSDEKKKLHIIAVVADARGAKSTLLNHILARLGGSEEKKRPLRRFLARSGGRTVTKGIWIWGAPLPLPNGDQLLLLDTQGTGLNDDSINTQLTTLACLLSSLVILNINGTINEEHKTLLGIVQRFAQKFQGTAAEQATLFPKLLVRSRDYRRMDFEADFPAELHHVPVSHPVLRQAMDAKLQTDLTELVDPVLAATVREICTAFPRRHWAFTLPPTEADLKCLEAKHVVTRQQSSFGRSMHQLVDYILELSCPKQIGSSFIGMDVLLPHISSQLQMIMNHQASFHIPTIIETLQSQQILQICERAREVYNAAWPQEDEDKKQGRGSEPTTDQELKQQHETAQRAALDFYMQETQRKNLPLLQVTQGQSQLNVILQTLYLPHQEAFRLRMYQKIEELKQQAQQDAKRQEEVNNEIKMLQGQVSVVSGQIQQLQSEITKAEEKLQQAERDKQRALDQLHHSSKKGGRNFCHIL